MRVLNHDPAMARDVVEPIFLGAVRKQDLVTDRDAELLRVTSVTFEDGARNKLHHHAADQVLIVTHGRGIIATETEQQEIVPGNVVFIPAGERHWHGAVPGCSMTHLAILTPGPMSIDE